MSSVYVYNNKLLLTQSNRVLAPKTRRLPDEYQEVEWIESTGTQYIDLGHKVNQNDDFEIIFAMTDSTHYTNSGVFGALNTNWATGNGYGIATYYYNGNYWISFYVSKTGTTGVPYLYQGSAQTFNKYKIVVQNKNVYVNDSYIGTSTIADATVNNNAYLFKMNYSSGLIVKAKIYYYKDSVCELIPCYRISDNVIGMYDIANDTFLTNSGTGTFTKGADV